ncbi:MAG: radical SAM family heme chaperone HemW [Tenuifilaceae bacterium]|nr:radical SAM family heme chaperone HemW [Tenuifilaceae bacterium]
MSGVYIHVPYCKIKCEYCDFYSVVSNSSIAEFANLIDRELTLRDSYLPERNINTIYFGGGTPSLLTIGQIDQILRSITNRYSICTDPEITLEANPDDLTRENLKQMRSIGVNRLSIGIQSFSDHDLKQLGRRHNSQQALNAVRWAAEAGFDNISIDLIYGLPYSSTAVWQQNLKQAFALPVKHLSCYHLIYEDGTPLQARVTKGLVKPVDEELSVVQFNLLQQLAGQNGYEHYEISNLAKDGCFARHNTSYWKQVPYLGLGPSAHSYSGNTRDWNPRSIGKWANSLAKGEVIHTTENLSTSDRINDYMLTSLRTIWGADIDYLKANFGDAVAQRMLHIAEKYCRLGSMTSTGKNFQIVPNRFLISDGIITDFLV